MPCILCMSPVHGRTRLGAGECTFCPLPARHSCSQPSPTRLCSVLPLVLPLRAMTSMAGCSAAACCASPPIRLAGCPLVGWRGLASCQGAGCNCWRAQHICRAGTGSEAAPNGSRGMQQRAAPACTESQMAKAAAARRREKEAALARIEKGIGVHGKQVGLSLRLINAPPLSRGEAAPRCPPAWRLCFLQQEVAHCARAAAALSTSLLRSPPPASLPTLPSNRSWASTPA